jgi:hypothetical protein
VSTCVVCGDPIESRWKLLSPGVFRAVWRHATRRVRFHRATDPRTAARAAR